MTAAPFQKTHNSAAASGTTLVLSSWTDATGTAASGNVAAGSFLGIKVWYEAGNSTVTVTDSAGQTWTEDATVFTNDGGTRSRTFYFNNSASASALTITVTYGTAVINRAAVAFNATGVDPSAYLSGGHSDVPPTASTATDGLSIAATPSTQPALVVGIARDFPGDAGAPAFGTGFNDFGTGINLGGTNGARVEWKRVTSTSSLNVTFTAGFGSHDYSLNYFVLKETVSGSPYTLTAAQGSYTNTGQAANLAHGYVLTAAQGVYTYTGSDAYRDIAMAAAQGSYTNTGQSANLVFARTLTASQGSYTVNGQTVALRYSGAPSTAVYKKWLPLQFAARMPWLRYAGFEAAALSEAQGTAAWARRQVLTWNIEVDVHSVPSHPRTHPSFP
jgi:hypothetical protein